MIKIYKEDVLVIIITFISIIFYTATFVENLPGYFPYDRILIFALICILLGVVLGKILCQNKKFKLKNQDNLI